MSDLRMMNFGKKEMYSVGEVIFDMTLAIRFMMPQDVDINSREIYDDIFNWAMEFEEASLHSDDDYYAAVNNFITKKVEEHYDWFD